MTSSRISAINGQLYGKSEYVPFEKFGTHRFTFSTFGCSVSKHCESIAPRIYVEIAEWTGETRDFSLVHLASPSISIEEAEQMIKALQRAVRDAKNIQKREAA